MFVRNGGEIRAGSLVSLVNSRTGYVYDVQRKATYWLSRDAQLHGIVVAVTSVSDLAIEMQFYVDMKASVEKIAVVYVFSVSLLERGNDLMNKVAMGDNFRTHWLPGLYIAVDNIESVDVRIDQCS